MRFYQLLLTAVLILDSKSISVASDSVKDFYQRYLDSEKQLFDQYVINKKAASSRFLHLKGDRYERNNTPLKLIAVTGKDAS